MMRTVWFTTFGRINKYNSIQATKENEKPGDSTNDPTYPARRALFDSPGANMSSTCQEQKCVHRNNKSPQCRAHIPRNDPDGLKRAVRANNKCIGCEIPDAKKTRETLNEVCHELVQWDLQLKTCDEQLHEPKVPLWCTIPIPATCFMQRSSFCELLVRQEAQQGKRREARCYTAKYDGLPSSDVESDANC